MKFFAFFIEANPALLKHRKYYNHSDPLLNCLIA